MCLLASDVRSVATMLNTKLFPKMDFVTDKIRLVLADLTGSAYGWLSDGRITFHYR